MLTVPLRVLREAPHPRCLQVWCTLAVYASRQAYADWRELEARGIKVWPSIPTVARDCRCSRERVTAAIGMLEAAGLLVVLTRGGGRTPSEYDLSPAFQGLARQPLELARQPQGLASQPEVVPSFGSKAPSVGHQKKDVKFATEVAHVFAYWQERLHPRAKLTSDRVRRLVQRLTEGYTVEELCEAVDGCAASQFHREGHHTDLTLICRSAAHVDRFRALRPERRAAQQERERLTDDELALRDIEAWLELHPQDSDAREHARTLRQRVGRPSAL